MRVALTSVHCWPDVRRGGERYVHELAAALARAGHDVDILSTGSRAGRDTVLGVPVRRLPVRHAPGAYPDPWQDVSIERAFGMQALAHLTAPVLAGRYDVWHATSTGDGAAAAVTGRLRRGLRTVFTDHGFPAKASRSARPDRREHGVVVRNIDDYVCVSRAAAEFLQRDYGRAATVVPPGVRLEAHHVADTREQRPTLLYAGSLVEPRKGVGLLLDAVELMLTDQPGLQVWLYGPGDPTPVLCGRPDAVRAAVTVARLADDDELRAAYGTAWVTVLPSHAESFGMTVVESLASGTPAVVLAEGGGPAEIIDDVQVGRRAEATAAGLAAACAEALELAVRPGTAAACRERAAAYDWDLAVVPELERVYAGARS
jgi:phosphatidylinositol alpha-mannosyltransferase